MSKSRRVYPVLAGLALAALVMAAYLPALSNGFVWDDDVYLTANPLLDSLAGLRRIWLEPTATVQYYPLTFTSFWIEVHLWGLEPFGFHLVNLLLHGLDAILLWRLLLALEVPAAWVAAALFAVHPLHVESVAWVTERKNVLSAAFALGSALCFLRADARRSAISYGVALLLFAAALLSKSSVCFLPGAILVVLWWRRGELRRRDLIAVAPFALLAIASAWMTAWVERHHVGALGADWALNPGERVFIAGRALWFYAGKVFWPEPLTFNYPAWQIDTSAPLQWLFPVSALAVVVGAFALRGRIGRGPLAAVLIFIGALLPVLGFVDFYAMRYSFVADHFAYLPSVALLALATATVARIAPRWGARGRRVAAWAAIAVVLLLLSRTRAQSHAYRDAETLWRDTLAKNPASWMAHNNLGALLAERGSVEDALPHWQEALRLAPPMAEIHRNLGDAARVQKDLAEAEKQYRRALELDPTIASTHNALAVVLAAQGRRDEATIEYRESLRLDPSSASVHNDLGVALASAGELAEAESEYRKALEIDPDLARAHSNLGLVLAATGRNDEALVHFAAAVRLEPDMAEAHNNAAVLLERTGHMEEALAQYEEVVRLAPAVPEARYNLAAALAKSGRTKEAIGQYREALRQRPDFTAAEKALARLFGE